jgi:LysR family transcriptional regulator for bpeEF and oprC
MLELELTRIFVKVVQNQSFSRAADVLNMPKSTVSKAITRLEKETATKLLIRSTRSLHLTPAGRAFYDASLGPIAQLEDAQKSLYGLDHMLAGLVRITAPEDLGTFVVAPAIAEISAQHPELRFELSYTDEIVDLVKDGFDVAVRIGKTRDSSLKLRRAGEVVLIPVASPAYLKSQDKIRSPQDLERHSTLCLDVRTIVDSWTLRSARGTVHVPVRAKIVSNQMSSLMSMAVAGAGVALVPKYLCQQELNRGRLIRLLPDWSTPGMPVSIISPLAPSSSARLKVTVERIHEALLRALTQSRDA